MLGELFDHGCDSVTTVFVISSVTVALQVHSPLRIMIIPDNNVFLILSFFQNNAIVCIFVILFLLKLCDNNVSLSCEARLSYFVDLMIILMPASQPQSELGQMLLSLTAIVAFYVAHWRTYVTGKLHFNKCVILFFVEIGYSFVQRDSVM